MIKISKRECETLRTQGVVMGDGGISRTVASGRKKTYYLCESPHNLELLKQIRK